MSRMAWLQRWEGMVFGFVLGFCACIACSLGYHEAKALKRLSVWERSVEVRHLERSAALIDRHLQVAMEAIADGRPLATSRYLAFELMGRLYEHHMAYGLALLESGQSGEFNQLRAATGFLLLDLSGESLAGVSLAGVDLGGATLARANLQRCDLGGADLTGADLQGANLSGADLTRTNLQQANLADAILTEVHGRDTDFRQAVLVNASLTRCTGLEGARFDDAELGQANLWASRFPLARFDRADLTLASAVDADFSEVASMATADFTGVNLGGARLRPEAMERAWLVGVDGLDPAALTTLRRREAVVQADEVLRLVDPRVVDGFRAQVEASDAVPAERRHAVLLGMLKGYYLR